MKKFAIATFCFLFFTVNFCKGQLLLKESVIKNNEAMLLWTKFPTKENIKKAAQLLEESIALDSTYKLAYVNRAQCLMMLGKLSEANKLINTALKYIPQNADLYFLKGIISIKLGKKALSQEMFDRSISLMEKEWKRNYKTYLIFNKALVQAYKGDKYKAFIELLAAHNLFYDPSFNSIAMELRQEELEYISKFDKNKEVRKFWAPSETVERGKYVIDYNQ